MSAMPMDNAQQNGCEEPYAEPSELGGELKVDSGGDDEGLRRSGQPSSWTFAHLISPDKSYLFIWFFVWCRPLQTLPT